MNLSSKNGNRILMVPIPLGSLSFEQSDSTYYKVILSETRVWVVENTRTMRRFLSSTGLGINIDNLIFFELNRDAKTADLHHFLGQHIKSGNIGVSSEAGIPGMADPGAAVAIWAHKNGIYIDPLVGPGSIVLALMASGLNGQQFTFHGYAPIKEPELKQFLAETARSAIKTGYTQIYIETPYRSDRFLGQMVLSMPPEILICIACDLHGLNQWICTRTAKDWKIEMPELGKTPCVFLAGVSGKGLNS